jgi:hypothetical protein
MIGRLCNLKLLMGLNSTDHFGHESRGTHHHILLSQIWDSPNFEGKVPVFDSPKEQGSPVIVLAPGSSPSRNNFILIGDFWDVLPCKSSSNRRFGERIVAIFCVPYGNRISQLCYDEITVNQPLNRGIQFMVAENCLLGSFHCAISYRFLLGLCTKQL